MQQVLDLVQMRRTGFLQHIAVQDLYTGETFNLLNETIIIPVLSFFWFQT